MTITINVKSGQNNWSVSIEASDTVKDLKEAIAVVSEVPAENQRLIFSGKILKDEQTVESNKIQDGHSVHMVKSGNKGNKSETSGSVAAGSGLVEGTGTGAGAGVGSVPSNISAGQTGGFNPLADLTGARYAGFANLPSADMFGPDGGLSNAPNSDDMLRMLENPIFQSQMNEMLSNPQMVDFLIQQNPQLQSLGPRAREMLQSPFFRQMMTDPQMIRQSMQMARAMGMNPNGEGDSSFPAPGTASTSNAENTGSASAATSTTGGADSAATGAGTAANPFANLLNPQANPFANLFPQGQQPQFNPELLSSVFGSPVSQQTADNRPPEERYESQLRQLNDMGFFDFDRNVAALRRSGGSVQGAVEALLNGDA